MRRLVRPLILLLALSLASACSDDDSSTSSDTSGETATTAASPAGTSGTEIKIKDFAFVPPSLKASSGDEIVVRNTDGVVHTVTADDKSFDTGNIDGNSEKKLKPSKAGTFSYFCNIHQYMKGTITVS